VARPAGFSSERAMLSIAMPGGMPHTGCHYRWAASPVAQRLDNRRETVFDSTALSQGSR